LIACDDRAKQVAAREQAEAEQALAQEADLLAKARELAMAQIATENAAAGMKAPLGFAGGLQDLEPEPEPVDEEMELVRRAFDSVDADRSGTLELEEVRNLTQILGRNVGEDELKVMMKEMDGDGGVRSHAIKTIYDRTFLPEINCL